MVSQSLSLLINIGFLFSSDKLSSILTALRAEINALSLLCLDGVLEAMMHGSTSNCVVKLDGGRLSIFSLDNLISFSYFCESFVNVDLS
mgnify:CR=1 FL=1